MYQPSGVRARCYPAYPAPQLQRTCTISTSQRRRLTLPHLLCHKTEALSRPFREDAAAASTGTIRSFARRLCRRLAPRTLHARADNSCFRFGTGRNRSFSIEFAWCCRDRTAVAAPKRGGRRNSTCEAQDVRHQASATGSGPPTLSAGADQSSASASSAPNATANFVANRCS
jgi:hypothetical protein